MADLDEAVAAHQTANEAVLEDQSPEKLEAYRDASEELHYQRWLSRGGPQQYEVEKVARDAKVEALEAAGLPADVPRLIDESLYERYTRENSSEASE